MISINLINLSNGIDNLEIWEVLNIYEMAVRNVRYNPSSHSRYLKCLRSLKYVHLKWDIICMNMGF